MDITTYALSKKIAAHAVSGVQSMSVSGQTLTINTKDSGVLTMTFPTPKDGVSVTDIDVNANNQIVFTMSDGSEFISGKIPTVKGDPGFSPIITENADNTDKIYKLDITTADSTFTTPNLKGADGQDGTGGDSSITLTQEEYEALTEEQKLNGLYYIYDTKRIYKNGVQYGASEPISLTMAEYKALKEAGAIDEQQEYLIEADDEGGSGSGTAENIIYTNENFPQYDNVDLALDALFNKVYYVKPICSLSASPSGGTFEMGTTITSPIIFTWTTNKAITSQTLTGCTLADASVRTAIYNTNVTADKTFTLSVSDDENFASSSVSYKFLNKILWGNSTEPTTYNSKFILELSNNKLASSNKGAFSFNCSDGEYAYFATPTSMKITSAWVNGFQADLEEVAVVNHTNASGYTSSYTITRFSNSGLGSFVAEVK